ncbi:MAG: hypothetical protein R3279_11220 [Putridiphycobacter sp.]|nr:hypothetical protein [Putridiphycobacter sp.]
MKAKQEKIFPFGEVANGNQSLIPKKGKVLPFGKMSAGQMGLLLLVLCLVGLSSCNKEKRFSSKLMKGQTWNVTNITLNNEPLAPKGQWLITTDVDIYDSVPSAKWTTGLEDAIFEWQFQDKGESFYLSYVQQKDEVDGNLLDTLDYFAYYLTGKYNVEVHKKDQMVFTSEETIKYTGEMVRIEIGR